MYAISFDLNTDELVVHYGKSYNNAYRDIAKFLKAYGFERQQNSVYFGNEHTNAVETVVAVRQMSMRFNWLKPCVKNIRMLRIEDDDDLSVAL
ncbi:MAG: CRISPR-associated endonuclease Cas2 [Ilumatobacter sp.]|nr:CRISPR-associated endonuclease Cas2 [Ilumatobacter sp.]